MSAPTRQGVTTTYVRPGDGDPVGALAAAIGRRLPRGIDPTARSNLVILATPLSAYSRARVEFIVDRDGRDYTYDINTNTNYSSDAEAVAGRSGMGAIADYLGQALDRVGRLGAEIPHQPVRAGVGRGLRGLLAGAGVGPDGVAVRVFDDDLEFLIPGTLWVRHPADRTKPLQG